MTRRRPSRYSAVAIALHWLIAIAILSMIPMGWWMSDAIVEHDEGAGPFGPALFIFRLTRELS